MENAQSSIFSLGVCFLGLFLSGFWLHHLGKPYTAIPFNLHKLIGLVTAVFLGMLFYRSSQQSPFTIFEIVAGVVTALLFIVTIIAGGLLNTGTPWQKILLTIHHITPYLTVLSTAMTLYLLVFH